MINNQPEPLKLLSLFSGIGAFEQALKEGSIPFELINFCEIDSYAALAYRVLHEVDASLNIPDVKDVSRDTLRSIGVDLITHGSPCQDFSVAGLNKGGEQGSGTRSSLLWETVRIVSEILPKYTIWEQVPSVLNKKHKHVYDQYLAAMEEYGYNNYYGILNAVDFDIPQNRKRVFTVSIRKDVDTHTFTFPAPLSAKTKLRDVLLNKVSTKYYLNQKQIDKFQYAPKSSTLLKKDNKITEECRTHPTSSRAIVVSQEGVAPTLLASAHKGPLTFLQPTKMYLVDATKKGYTEAQEGDGVVLGFIGSARGVVQQQQSPTLQTGNSTGVVVINDNPSFAITASGRHEVSVGIVSIDGISYSIRRLVPQEYFRLMGFSDDAFYKIAVCGFSDSRLYKMAGNSIVVPVLTAILTNLFKERSDVDEIQ